MSPHITFLFSTIGEVTISQTILLLFIFLYFFIMLPAGEILEPYHYKYNSI